ncbi:hydroxyacylglutathione hydrolase [Desulfosarcina alkanivorans]|uniref:hydroxyacylglutathione hydrolase n=1 Tax=Desulfosarcina alkanivorans TaxID=571177 RepID=A0A5K7Z070_9BACT|nr:hydroxyacylglutathione hydrolase C-terminal domain-containing protein [Desulfosarcina alkanivorans]BBO71884.1 hydroxyacylglutathione hydrolase [Desulfosarcina alkanivorans]
MKIKQFLYGGDNLGYLLYTGTHALAIDGGAVDDIVGFVRKNNLTLSLVTNTHGHGDHTTGTRQLVNATGASYLDHRRFVDGQTIGLAGGSVTVRLTPGHTTDSVTFAADDFLITGDTLFNGTVGNCFSGDLKAFHRSIRLLMGYPGSHRIYAGHDYVAASLAFARQLTPDNSAIDAYAARYDRSHVVSTLDDELAVNPYLRFNAPDIISILKLNGLPTASEYQRWEGIMSIE